MPTDLRQQFARREAIIEILAESRITRQDDLVKALADGSTVLAGTRTLARDTRIGYFAQHQLEQLQAQHSPVEHLLQHDPGLSEQQARDFLGGFGFAGERALDPVAPLSGGEKSRLVLALLVALSFLLLLGRQPGSRAIVELEALLQDDVYRVDAGKNIIRCKMAIASVDDAIDQYHQWLSGDLFTSHQLESSHSGFLRKDLTNANTPDANHDKAVEFRGFR
mgnify:CR=1 FL=1